MAVLAQVQQMRDDETYQKYRELLGLCEALKKDMQILDKRGRDLNRDILDHIDKQKVKDILEDILNQK